MGRKMVKKSNYKFLFLISLALLFVISCDD
jgi:hypothetical protein